MSFEARARVRLVKGKRVILAGLFSAREPEPLARLASLAERTAALGGLVVGQVLQRRGVSRAKRPGGSKRMDDPLGAMLFGKGKAEELAALCASSGAELVIFHNRLTEHQRRSLERLCQTPVADAVALGVQ